MHLSKRTPKLPEPYSTTALLTVTSLLHKVYIHVPSWSDGNTKVLTNLSVQLQHVSWSDPQCQLFISRKQHRVQASISLPKLSKILRSDSIATHACLASPSIRELNSSSSYMFNKPFSCLSQVYTQPLCPKKGALTASSSQTKQTSCVQCHEALPWELRTR